MEMIDNHRREGSSPREDKETDDFFPVEPAEDVAENDDDSVNQVDHGDPTNGTAPQSIQNDPDDSSATEDGGREDMFVDCPEEMEIPETLQSFGENDNIQDTQFEKSYKEIEIQNLMEEIQRLSDMLAEKDRLAQQYEEERAAFSTEVAHLYHKSKALNQQQSLLGKNGDGLVDHLCQMEVGVEEEKSLVAGTLHKTISEWSKFVGNALNEHSQMEGQIRELHSTLYMKDQESDLLNAKYTRFLSEANQLRECLAETVLDLDVQDEIDLIVIARSKMLEIRRNEEYLYQNLWRFEAENRKLMEHLDEQKLTVENSNAENSRLNAEISGLGAQVEQEKAKCANIREKLNLAVSRGKALVQHRDSLKQSLAEKTSELENCLIELQEKRSALEAAEESRAQSQILVASLHDSLAKKDMILQECGELLSESDLIEEHQSLDLIEKLKWLTDESKRLKFIFAEYNKLKDALSLCDFPETVLSSELDACIHWLLESFNVSKGEAVKLRDEIAETKEAANSEIDSLITSFFMESQDKSYLLAEMEDLRNENETLSKLQHEVAKAKEAANIEIDCLKTLLFAGTEEKNYLHSELEILKQKYEEFVQKEYQVSLEKDQILSMLLEASGIAKDSQEGLSGGQFNVTMFVDKCLAKMKEETCYRESSQIGVDMFEELQTLLYVTDQELRLHELMVEEDFFNRTQMHRLVNELERVHQELNTVKDKDAILQKNLKMLEEKNSILREKLSMAVKKGKWLVQERDNLKGALSEKNTELDKLKTELQQKVFTLDEYQDKLIKLSLDVERIPKLEADLVAMKEHGKELEEFLSKSKSMLERLMESIDHITLPADLAFEEHAGKVQWLAGYLGECETVKAEMEQELRKVKEETSSLASKLLESRMTTKSLQDALSEAEQNFTQLLEEKKGLEVFKTRAEDELEKANKKAYLEKLNFEEISAIRRSLEDSLLLAENNISKIENEKEVAMRRSYVAEEGLQKLEEEFSVYSSKLDDAGKTIQSLEDALSQAQKNISLLSEENNNLENSRIDLESEIKKLKDKADLQASKLAKTSSSIKSLEEELLTAESNKDNLVNEKKIAEQEILELNSRLNNCMQELAGIHGSTEIQSLDLSRQLSRLQLLLKDEMVLSLQQHCFEKKIQSLKDMDLLLEEIEECFLKVHSDVLLNSPVIQDGSSMNIILPSFDNICNLEVVNRKANAVEGESILLDVGKMVEGFQLKDKILAERLKYISAFIDESHATMLRKFNIAKDRMINIFELIKSMEKKVKDVETDKQRLESNIVSLESDMQKRLEEGKQTCARVMEEKEQYRDRIIQVETDLEARENLLNELRLKQDDYLANVEKLKERETELSSLYVTSLSKVHELEDSLLSASDTKILFDKLKEIEVPDAMFAARGVEARDAADLRKLFYIMDSFSISQQMVNSLSNEREELLSNLDKQVSEIEYLKNKVKERVKIEDDLERMKNEMLELDLGLRNIIRKLGGNGLIDDHKVVGVMWLLPILDKLVMAMELESENLKLKTDELGAKLLGSQMPVNDLSNKVKLLQDSNQPRIASIESGQEKGAFEESSPTKSEISEIQDKVTLGKSNNISPVSSAAHVRTMRISPSDNVAISIDSESDRFVNNEEVDDDKGHIFKSLNTSGLIPGHGKTVADRMDGIWVSSGRALMGRPRARLGVIAYCLFLHVWLLGTIL